MTRSEGFAAWPSSLATATTMLIDVSDLVYYLGHHDHLTGIQRVQASLAQEFLTNRSRDVAFIAFEPRSSSFLRLSSEFLAELLDDLMLPVERRQVLFDRLEARQGRLPGCVPLQQTIAGETGSCILLLGAAWVIPDYFRHVNVLREEIGATFACVIHDLIPIYARETCDQGTANVFKNFLATSRLSTDLYICVSENTCRDLIRYFDESGWDRPRATVVTNATALPSSAEPKQPAWFTADRNGFVLVVSTIEGRKNHALLLNVWRRLTREHADEVPKLICVGRPGWRCEDFLLKHLASGGLGGKIEIHSDVSDGELAFLYKHCRFTVYPSFYEGWGLPIAESLAYGKYCLCSNTSSMPEVGGDFVGYFDPQDAFSAYEAILAAILDPAAVARAERRIEADFVTRDWAQVAADYGDALLDLSSGPTPRLAPSGPGHFVFRAVELDVEGALGAELMANVAEHLRSDLKPGTVALESFEKGHLARGKGNWFAPETWGSWIGFDGGTLRFALQCREEMYIYCAYQVLAPFAHSKLKVVINSVPTIVALGDTGACKVMILKFMPTEGNNTITFVGGGTAEQRSASLAIDGRGLMIGLREMVVLPKSDIEARLDLMQAVLLT